MIRPACANDVDSIAALWNPLIRNTMVTFSTELHSVQDLQCRIAQCEAEARPFLVAEVEGQLAGFATYGPFRPGPGYVRTVEHTIILGAHHQRRGVGRGLMAELEFHAKAQGIKTMMGAISSGQTRVRLLFMRALVSAKSQYCQPSGGNLINPGICT